MKQPLDKSISSPSVSKSILSLLRKDQRRLGEKVHYLIGRDGRKIVLGMADVEKDVLNSYTLEWDTAIFIGYCLVSEAIKIAGGAAADYILDLAKRRKETTAAVAFATTLFSDIKRENSDDYHGEGIA